MASLVGQKNGTASSSVHLRIGGVRRAQLCALDIQDIDLRSGRVMVRHGKGDRFSSAFMGSKTKRAARSYLRHRSNALLSGPLWCAIGGVRLRFSALRDILQRRSKRAGVSAPSPHGFRRTFALASLRGGADIFALHGSLATHI